MTDTMPDWLRAHDEDSERRFREADRVADVYAIYAKRLSVLAHINGKLADYIEGDIGETELTQALQTAARACEDAAGK